MKTITLEKFKTFAPCWMKTEEGREKLEEIGRPIEPASSAGRRKGMRIVGRGISMAAIPEHHRLDVRGERKRSLWNTF